MKKITSKKEFTQDELQDHYSLLSLGKADYDNKIKIFLKNNLKNWHDDFWYERFPPLYLNLISAYKIDLYNYIIIDFASSEYLTKYITSKVEIDYEFAWSISTATYLIFSDNFKQTKEILTKLLEYDLDKFDFGYHLKEKVNYYLSKIGLEQK